MLSNVILPLIGSGILAATSGAAIYYATYGVRSQWLGHAEWHGRRDTRAVALTFDDGPSRDTERVLDILGEHNVAASFFMIGRQVESFPGIAERVVAEDHEVGNHSYSHPIYLYHRARRTRQELERAQAVISETTGIRPRFARPPCGVRTRAYFAATRSLGLRTVQWDVAGFDWKQRSAKQIARDVLHGARAGSIVLLHDGNSDGKRDRRETIAALPLIIKGLHDKGLRVAPLNELLKSVQT
jgi:peptidoglycan-N-acetylglucosamine deacetylase